MVRARSQIQSSQTQIRKPARKQDLSPARRSLVELMQEINFGRIEKFAIRAGEPVLSPAPGVICDIKICGDNGIRRERERADFVLKAEILDLFGHFDRLENARIACLQVKHGLPFHMSVEVSA